jgi:hypothetical protein
VQKGAPCAKPLSLSPSVPLPPCAPVSRTHIHHPSPHPTPPPTPQVTLEGARELICLAVQDHLVAAGSRTHLHLLDARQRCTNVGLVPVTDNGVRSLQLAGHMLSAGTGDANVVFYDLRYLRRAKGPRLRGLGLQVGRGGAAGRLGGWVGW